jgi:hypothetical protein
MSKYFRAKTDEKSNASFSSVFVCFVAFFFGVSQRGGGVQKHHTKRFTKKIDKKSNADHFFVFLTLSLFRSRTDPTHHGVSSLFLGGPLVRVVWAPSFGTGGCVGKNSKDVLSIAENRVSAKCAIWQSPPAAYTVLGLRAP